MTPNEKSVRLNTTRKNLKQAFFMWKMAVALLVLGSLKENTPAFVNRASLETINRKRNTR